MDFHVLSDIQITMLGAYDSGQDGFNGPITVDIFNRDTQTLVAGLTQVFTGTMGTLALGDRFVSLVTPITLAAGFHGTVVAFGYGANGDINDNDGIGPFFGGNTTNTGGGLISFVGTGDYGTQTAYPTIHDSGPANRYAAGTFSSKWRFRRFLNR
jgi:hypothetical protein